MRSSTIFALLGATLAFANSVVKKGEYVDNVVVTDVVYVTVNEGAPAATPQAPAVDSHAPSPEVSSTSTAQGEVTTPATSKVQEKTASASSSGGSSSGGSSSNPCQDKAMSGHNDVRPKHSAPTFAWNDTLAEYASEETSCSKFAHDMSHGSGYGQNIYAAFSTAEDGYTVTSAMDGANTDWYNEESLFNQWGVNSPTINDAWLHFTQMVWVDSVTLGCAVKTCGTDNTIKSGWYVWYVVCNYYPVGNVVGDFASNVKES